MNILAIESSCDETSAAILTEENGLPVLVSNIVSSQIDIHKEFGGVVPEVAARAHIENIVPVISKALHVAFRNSPAGAAAPRGENELLKNIDYIAVTAGPGLIGSLVVGVETAKSIGLATGKPVIPLNHLEGHIYANFVSQITNHKSQITNKSQESKLINSELTRNSRLASKRAKIENRNFPSFPVVALLVSGGHTMLIHMPDHLSYEIVGSTWDDAAGEAFDKVAKVIGLGYPGGPAISMAAKSGDGNKYKFPVVDLTQKPKRGDDGFLKYPEPSLDFSFSGLKTSVITEVKKIGEVNLTQSTINDLAASFEKAVVETLVQNSLRSIKKFKPKSFILSGGVAANRALRKALEESIKESYPKTKYYLPDSELCTDNAGMIAAAAYYHIRNTKYSMPNTNFTADPNMKL